MIADLPILWRMLRGTPTAGDHQQRLEGFYGPQADRYDAFRERLLQGRQDLLRRLELPRGGTLVELGGGTGRNLEFLGDRHKDLYRAWVVDLCRPLLARAEDRARRHGWNHVEAVHGDATAWRPPRPVDAVLCSYSLTMIPDWWAAIDNAEAMLAPGGRIAVVDFYVSRRHPEDGLTRHGLFTRTLWPWWFGHDGVHLSQDHLPYLRRRFRTELCEERRAKVPWLPGVTVPYYVFIGRR